MTDAPSPRLPPLPWLRAFEAAARRLSFTAAGQELGLTQAAISQQIRLLEERLGTALFERQRRGVRLTPAGAAYLPHVQGAFALLARRTEELFAAPTTRIVRLLAPVSFTILWLAPRLAALHADAAGPRLEIATMHVPADYTAPGYDLDIRFGAGAWPGRVAHRLTTERLTPVAAPVLAAREGNWREWLRLALAGPREMWRDWFALDGRPPPSAPTIGFDTFAAATAAAEAGTGVLLGSRPLIDVLLASGRLRRLSALDLPSAFGHFVTHAAGVALSPAAEDMLRRLLQQAAAE
jgi:DNA-binding transcriptional LysR family regulator